MNEHTSTSIILVVFLIMFFGGLTFEKWSHDQVIIECYKTNVELLKQGKPVELCREPSQNDKK